MADIYFSDFADRDALLSSKIDYLQNARRINHEAERLFKSLYNDRQVTASDGGILERVGILLAASIVEASAANSLVYSTASGDANCKVFTKVGTPVGCLSFALTTGNAGTIAATVGGSENVWPQFGLGDWILVTEAEDEENNGLFQAHAANAPTATVLQLADGGDQFNIANSEDISIIVTKVGTG